MVKVKTSEELWEELHDVPVDNEGCIDVSFYEFLVGTDREEIWSFLEEREPGFSVAKAMGLIK